MKTQQRITKADVELRRAAAAFERSVVASDRPPLPAFIGVVRACGDLTRFALDVTFDSDTRDPIHLQPRILRSA